MTATRFTRSDKRRALSTDMTEDGKSEARSQWTACFPDFWLLASDFWTPAFGRPGGYGEGLNTRSHPELGRENPQRRWYCVLRRGRVGRRQVFQARDTEDGNQKSGKFVGF